MRKSVFVLAVCIVLFLVLPLTDATTYKLLCLQKSQTIRYSLCNPDIADWTCTSSMGCQQCVSVINGKYCPASPNICNTKGYACSPLDSGDALNTSNTNNNTVSGWQLDILSTSPALPISTTTKGLPVQVSFTSSRYPVDVTFLLYSSTNQLLQSSSPSSVISAELSSLVYTLPSTLSSGAYVLRASFAVAGQTPVLETLGTINLQSTSSSQNTTTSTNTTSQNTTQSTPHNSSESNSSSSTYVPKSSSSNNSVSIPSRKPRIDVGDAPSDTNIPQEKNALQNNSVSLPAKITGAVIGTLTGFGFTTLLIIALLVLILLLWKTSQEFKKN